MHERARARADANGTRLHRTDCTRAGKLCLEDKKQQLLVYKRKGEGDFDSTYMIRAEVVLDYPPEVVHELLYNYGIRHVWDEVVSNTRVLEVEDESHDIIYFTVSLPVVSNRDVVQARGVRPTRLGGRLTVFHSINHPDAPVRKGYVRARTVFGGLWIDPLPHDRNRTRVVACNQNDPMGSIPTMVVNMTASRAPPRYFKTLINACKNFREIYGSGELAQFDIPSEGNYLIELGRIVAASNTTLRAHILAKKNGGAVGELTAAVDKVSLSNGDGEEENKGEASAAPEVSAAA